MDIELPDGQVVTGIPEGTTKLQLMSKLAKNGYNVEPLRKQITEQDQAATKERFKAEEAARPWGEKALAVAGGAFHRTGQALAGIPRLFGADIGPTKEDVAEHDKYRGQLHDITPGATAIEIGTDLATLYAAPGAGLTGLGARIAARALPRAAGAITRATSAAPGTKRALAQALADRAATGGAVAAATTPGDWGDRALSGGLGAGGGAAPGALGMAARAAGRKLGNQGSQAGRIVEEMGAPQARALATRLDDPAEREVFNRAGVSRPTAAQLTEDPALQRLETGARVTRGDLFAEGDARTAREQWEQLGTLAGTPADLRAAESARKSATDPLRTGALARARAGQGAHAPDLTHRIELVVNDILQGEARTNPQAAKLANWVRGELEQGVTPEQLYTMRKTLTSGIQPGNEISAAASFARAERGALIDAIDEGLTLATGGTLGQKGARGGQWDPYLQTYQRLSQPVTSMKAGQAMQDAFAATKEIPGAPGARELTAHKLKGALEKHGEKQFGGKTISRVTPQERQMVEDIARTIERADRGKKAQGTIGSATAGNQQAAKYVEDIMFGGAGGGLTAYAADEAGLGNVGGGFLAAAGLGRAMRARRERALANLLQDPAKLRQALLVAMRNQERGATATRFAAPGSRELAEQIPEE